MTDATSELDAGYRRHAERRETAMATRLDDANISYIARCAHPSPYISPQTTKRHNPPRLLLPVTHISHLSDARILCPSGPEPRGRTPYGHRRVSSDTFFVHRATTTPRRAGGWPDFRARISPELMPRRAIAPVQTPRCAVLCITMHAHQSTLFFIYAVHKYSPGAFQEIGEQ